MRLGRAAYLAFALCGCGAPAPAPPMGSGLTVELRWPSAGSFGGDVIADSAEIDLRSVRALSDRAGLDDARTRIPSAPLSLGKEVRISLADAPSAVYSRISVERIAGLVISGRWRDRPLSVRIEAYSPVSVRCLQSVFLGPAGAALLSLVVDSAGWFDGLALASADTVDGVIVIDSQTNRALASALEVRAARSLSASCGIVEEPDASLPGDADADGSADASPDDAGAQPDQASDDGSMQDDMNVPKRDMTAGPNVDANTD